MASYCTYSDYAVIFSKESQSLDIVYKHKTIVSGLTFLNDGVSYELSVSSRDMQIDHNLLTLKCGETVVSVRVGDNGVALVLPDAMTVSASTCCDGLWRAMSRDGHSFFRSSLGQAVTALDDMLFNRESDTALTVDGVSGRVFAFDRESGVYNIDADANGTITFSMTENVYANRYNISYSPVRSNDSFDGHAPVGWMTWYAVKFDASEETVLANAKWMAENLKKYGAETIWVDWEWYHKDMKGIRDDGCDSFHPDKVKYPHGLKYVSDEIKKLGLIPSLWIGFTVDPGENDFIKANPETVLVDHPSWCGRYFFDMSNPKYLNEFLPRALKQVDEWGYDAVKYDTLPLSMRLHEYFHDSMYDKTLSLKEVFRNMVKKTREVLGGDRYMLSCAGVRDAEILWACDMFDAARIGGDIFKWEEFVKEAVGRTARYYPFHNNAFYNDPDNVVIREEFNNMDEAFSRCAFVSLLGMPVTFGDDLTKLPEERVELLRRSIPVPDIRPMDLGRTSPDDMTVTVLAIDGEVGAYTVISLLNTTDDERDYAVDLARYGIDYTSPLHGPLFC